MSLFTRRAERERLVRENRRLRDELLLAEAARAEAGQAMSVTLGQLFVLTVEHGELRRAFESMVDDAVADLLT
jgi:hypothetical protein